MLLPIAEDRFFSPAYGCDVTFDMADDGTATALVYRPVDIAPIIFKKVGRPPAPEKSGPTRHR